MVTRFEIRDLNLDLRSIRHARMQAVAQQQPNSSPQGLLGMGGAAANAARGSGRSAGRAAARVAAQRPLAAKWPERPKAAKWPCGRRPRGEAVERPEAVGGGHYRRPAAAKVWLWAAAVSAAAAAISGHSRFSSLALVLLVSLALREGPSQGDVLPFSIVRAPPPHAFASIDAFRSCAVHICTLCLFHRRRWWWLWGLQGAPRGGAAAPSRSTSIISLLGTPVGR